MKITCEQFLRKDDEVYSTISNHSLWIGFIDSYDKEKIEKGKKALKVFNVVSLSKAKELRDIIDHYIKLVEESGTKYKGKE